MYRSKLEITKIIMLKKYNSIALIQNAYQAEYFELQSIVGYSFS